MKNLRNKLDEFVLGNELEHYEFIESIRKEYSHTIIRYTTNYMMPNENCILFAFLISGNINYSKLSKNYNKSAGNDFGNWLIQTEKLTKIDCDNSSIGDYIIYQTADEKFIHIATIVDSKKVRSKWGAHGKYEHNIWDVPTSYGNHIKFYRKISKDKAIELFDIFCKE